MVNLISHTDFDNDLFRPAINGVDAVNQFNAAVTTLQEEFLIKVLGQIEYNKFVADIDPDTGLPTSQHWEDFLNGLTYTYDGQYTAVYDGIKRTLKLYVYCSLLKLNTSYVTPSGELLPAFENGERSKANTRLIDAWNEMYRLLYHGVNSLEYFFDEYSDLFPDLYRNYFHKLNYFGI